MSSPANPVSIGLFGIGLDTYWKQFDGLHARLTGYLGRIESMLAAAGARVVQAGLVDSTDRAAEAARLFVASDVQMTFLYVSTYALSSTVLPVVQRSKVPVVVLNLQPEAAIDYASFNAMGDRAKMTGEWLAYCQACAVPEIASVFHRAGIPFNVVTGTLDEAESRAAISDWIDAARTAHVLSTTHLGILGHYYNGMLDVYSDPTQIATHFGTDIRHIEIDALKDARRQVTDAECQAKLNEIRTTFTVLPECPPDELVRAARTACALDRLVASTQLGALAYYYEGLSGSEEEDIITSIITGNSLLTARHIPVAGECEVKNVMAMKILDTFGCGGSFSEFYAMDFNDDVVLLGHDGPGHLAIAEGKPLLKPLGVYHGKPGKGLSVEMRVKNGPVTLLSVVQRSNGTLAFLVAEAESVPGPILEIGNTNSRYRFRMSAREFINAWSRQGPAHHCAIGVGHQASKLQKLGALLNVEVTII